MIHLGVLFGSRTCEHDVSIVSALQLMDNVDKTKYHVVPVYIDRSGQWYTGDALRRIETFRAFSPGPGVKPCFLEPRAGTAELVYWKKGFFTSGRRVLAKLDVVIPVFHGMHGEDGTVQGLLELCDMPYASCGVMACAVGMDKIAMKLAFIGAGLPVLDARWVDRASWKAREVAELDRLEAALSYPLYVKPANLGSSIGINKATDRESLKNAIDIAVHYDRRVLVEKGVEDICEINCSGLGYGGRVEASPCEMPLSWQTFLSFEDKYLSGSGKGKTPSKGGAKGGMASAKRQIPAPISDELTARIQALTKKAFEALDCKGVVRIDFIVDKATDEVYINEINTIPGSLSFYLWEPAGLPYARLIDRMVDIAFEAKADKMANTFSFDSPLLSAYGQGGGTKGSKGSKA